MTPGALTVALPAGADLSPHPWSSSRVCPRPGQASALEPITVTLLFMKPEFSSHPTETSRSLHKSLSQQRFDCYAVGTAVFTGSPQSNWVCSVQKTDISKTGQGTALSPLRFQAC